MHAEIFLTFHRHRRKERMGISVVSVGAEILQGDLKKISSKSPATKTGNEDGESLLILRSSGLSPFAHLRSVCPSNLSPGPLFSILTIRLAWKNFSWHRGTRALSIDLLVPPSSCLNWAITSGERPGRVNFTHRLPFVESHYTQPATHVSFTQPERVKGSEQK